MMNCKSCKENVSNFLEGDLDAQQKSDYQQHLDKCPPCDKTVVGVRTLCNNLHSMQKINAPSDFDAVLHARIRREGQKRSFFSLRWLAHDHRIQLPVIGLAGALALILLIIGFQTTDDEKGNPQPWPIRQPRVVNYVMDEVSHSQLVNSSAVRTEFGNGFMTSSDSITARSVTGQNSEFRFRTVNQSQIIAF